MMSFVYVLGGSTLVFKDGIQVGTLGRSGEFKPLERLEKGTTVSLSDEDMREIEDKNLLRKN